MKNLNAFILFFFILPCVNAAVSDLYDFGVNKSDAIAGFESNHSIINEPEKLQATYQFIDENNNSLFDYLTIQPRGDLRIYDAFSDLIIAKDTTKFEDNNIDLKEFYAKKAEGPYRIVVEKNGELYEITTDNETYFDFEKPILPDLSVEVFADNILVKNNYADAFNFEISVYKDTNQTLIKKVNYLKWGEEYIMNYSSTKDTKVFVDMKNDVEESEEENNYAVYSTSTSAVTLSEQTGLVSTNSATLFKHQISNSNSSKNIESEKLGVDETGFSNDASEINENPTQNLETSGKQNLFTGNVVLNTAKMPSRFLGFLIIVATGILGVYLYNLFFKKN